jgi:hypothetical protein
MMAAGLGFKTFTTGEVLTAGDVNGYLMQGINVFTNAAARDAAITAPAEGQFAFTKDNNSLWYYDGAAWVASGATGDIEGVTAGVGISGGGTSGTVTVTNSMATAIDAKGDLVPGTGADTFSRLAVGANDTVLTADSSTATGLKWATPAATSPTFVGCSIFNTSTTINNATDTLLTFDSELFDTNGFHSTSVNTGRITIPTGYAGKYLVTFAVRYISNSTGLRAMNIYKNNVSIVEAMDLPGNSVTTSYLFRSVILTLAEADYLTFYTYQNSGSSMTAYLRSNEMPVQVQWLGA